MRLLDSRTTPSPFRSISQPPFSEGTGESDAQLNATLFGT